MKNKIILLFAILCLCFSQAVSQNQSLRIKNESILGSKSNESGSHSAVPKKLLVTEKLGSGSSESKLDIAKLKSLSKSESQKEDTLYCKEIVRRYSWLEPLGVLSKEEALRFPRYYRFTMKNELGHWQHIESMSKNELTRSYHRFYYDGRDIGEIDDSISSSIDKISQWFEFSDLEGKDLLEERAYDAEGNLLMTGMFHKHEDGRIIVCYNDSHGFPVDFLPDDRYTYGHVFAITYDERGKDYIVAFFDGAGLSRMNAYGCYQYRQVVDEREFIVEKSCHNSVGHLMNNKFGFARTTLDVSPDEKLWIRKHYDKDNNLVKPDMPGTFDGFMIWETEYDDFGQDKFWKYYIMKDGVKVNDEIDGVHCYEFYGYMSDGSFSYKRYDKNFKEIED